MYQGKIYHGGENGYAKTGIVDFPHGDSVLVCVVILRPRLTSMVMAGRLVNLTKLFLDRLRPSCTYFRQLLTTALLQLMEGESKYVAGLGIEPGTSALESDALPTALRGPAERESVCV